jgi:hypothetical protein
MTGTVRRLKINRRHESFACAWCGDALGLGVDGAICEACESPHHAGCWDQENGCGRAGCINTPLRQATEGLEAEEELSVDTIRCPHCRKVLPAKTIVCSGCQRITTESGLYDGPRKTAPEAITALMLGITSLVVPPILGLGFYSAGVRLAGLGAVPVIIGFNCGASAIRKAIVAKSQITNDPSLKGLGVTIAAEILGGIGIAFQVLGVIVLFMALFS